MKKNSISLGQKRKIHGYFRAIIQFVFFILFPSGFTAAFAGVKYIFIQLGCGSSMEWTVFLNVLGGLCLYTILFGRFFCGFACAFGSLGDGVRAAYVWLCKKRKRKPVTLNISWMKYLSVLKYGVLLIILFFCFTGRQNQSRGTSPWDVFSMLRVGNFDIKNYWIGALLLFFILIGMALQERFFCRVLCPMGAVFSFLPSLPVTGLFRKQEDCLAGCEACKKVCPTSLEIAECGTGEVQGDCFQCGKCMDVCPKQNIRMGMPAWKGNALWYVLVRAVLLAVLFKIWMK